VEAVRASGAESVAVCLLFSFAEPAHEKRLGELLEPLGLPVSLSHRILAEFREYERAATTCVNAYVSPRMDRYIAHLLDHLEERDTLRIMQSNGGSISADTARQEPVRTILSGPAGGVVGALALGRLAGQERLITFDMGGTSTDVSLLDRALSLTLEAEVAGFPVKTPMLDIHTVGAGGGSLARVDAGGSLRVGPESAGADPGPVCYGKGAGITVTDANLFLGRLVPEHFLGGRMRLHPERLQEPFERLAAELGKRPEALAEGVLAVANANMERAIRVISVERGHDPREFCLFSFGGAGGLHAAHLARLLNMPRVLVPRNPGILSAMGMLMADVLKDYSHTVMLAAEETDAHALARLFRPLEERALREMELEGAASGDMVLERALDMRYQGQSFEIVTPFDPQAEDFCAPFHALHERAYGYRHEQEPVAVVNLRLRARGLPPKPDPETLERGGETPPAAARLGERQVVFEGRRETAALLRREALQPGNRVQGPAVLVEHTSTILVPPFASGRVDDYGNLLLEIAP
jgi:N-methylhydantoinase A